MALPPMNFLRDLEMSSFSLVGPYRRKHPLRYYQDEASGAAVAAIEGGEAALVVIGTGGGKSIVISEIVYRLLTKYPNSNITVLVHVKELVAQDAAELRETMPRLDVAIFCAGLNSKRIGKVTVANIKSVANNKVLQKWTDIIIIDEVDLVPNDDVGQYRLFLNGVQEHNASVGLIGLTATPFRLGSGDIYGPDKLFPYVCYSKPLGDLIREGFLSPFTTREGGEFDGNGIRTAGGDFVMASASEKMSAMELVDVHTDRIITRGANRNSVLIFACDTKHALRIVYSLKSKVGEALAELVVSDSNVMSDKQRDERIAAFANGQIKYLVNVGVMTTGTNIPRIDCVVLLRPTKSKRLFMQIIGRGSRLWKEGGKTDCLLLDFGGNCERFGFIDELELTGVAAKSGMPRAQGAPEKACKGCGIFVPNITRVCPECSYEFPAPVKKNYKGEYRGALTSDQVSKITDVFDVTYHPHVSAAGNDAIRVRYKISPTSDKFISEFLVINFSHAARQRIAEFMGQLQINEAYPTDMEGLLTFLRSKAPKIVGIEVQREGKYKGVKLRYREGTHVPTS